MTPSPIPVYTPHSSPEAIDPPCGSPRAARPEPRGGRRSRSSSPSRTSDDGLDSYASGPCKRARLSGSPSPSPTQHWVSPPSSPAVRAASSERAFEATLVQQASSNQDAVCAVLSQPQGARIEGHTAEQLRNLNYLMLGVRGDVEGSENMITVDAEALLALPCSAWRTLFELMPNLNSIDIHGVPQGLQLFERMVFAGLPLEQLEWLNFDEVVHFDAQRFESLQLQTLRMTSLQSLVLPGQRPQGHTASGQVGGWGQALWGARRMAAHVATGRQAQLASGAQEPGPSNALPYYGSMHALTALRHLVWPMKAPSQVTLDLTQNTRLNSLKLTGDWDHFVRSNLLPPFGLKDLNLSDCNLSAESGTLISQAPWAAQLLSLNLNNNPKIKRLDLSGFASLIMLDVTGSLSGPQALRLPSRRMPTARATTFGNLFDSDGGLQHLLLSGCHLGGQLEAVDLFELPLLTMLNVAGCSITGDDVRTWAIPRDNRLIELFLDDNALGAVGLEGLSRLPLPHLEFLSLQQVGMTQEGAVALVRGGGVQARWPKLREIRFGHVADKAALSILQAMTERPEGGSMGVFS